MKVALAHDSLTQFGGAERVLQALHEIYPDAPVFTLVYGQKLKEHFEGWQIISSPLQYLYNFLPRLQFMLPFIPLALHFFDFSEFDLVISSSSTFIKAIHLPKNVLHINYCHTPARFLWMDTEQYLKDEVPAFLRLFLKIYLIWMRQWDYQAAQRVDFFIANSMNVQKRIQRYYNRESKVIYPFVDLNSFYPSAPKEDYYLLAGRLQPYKNGHLVIEVFNKLSKPLHVVGIGRAKFKLEKMSKENIQFLGKVSHEVLRNELSAAKAFIFPQEEDFGLLPIEANACGTAIIALGKGGVLESQIAGKTAVFFYENNAAALLQAIEKFEESKFLSEDIFGQAQKFSKEHFKNNIYEFVKEKYNAHATGN
jgi:glycosyltransferase involved in cell wall biosynthesis